MNRNDERVLNRRRIQLDLSGSGVSNALLLGRLNYVRAALPLDMHVHDDMLEICYLHRGRQTYALAGREYNLTGGDVFISYPNESHGTGGKPEEKSVLYWLQISTAGRNFLDLPKNEGRDLLGAIMAIGRHRIRNTRPLNRPLDRIIVAHAAGEKRFATLLRSMLADFLLETIAAAHEREKNSASDGIQKSIAHVKAVIREHVRLEDLAAKAGLSLSRFKCCFKAEVGIPPREYVLREKIDAAQEMLVAGRMSVTAVAYALSFSSSQYFATVFKRYTGRCPVDFRARRRPRTPRSQQ